VSQTKAELIKGLNINASAPATALQIDASGNVNIDSNTLYVDATNNRVGIGTTGPSSTLHVVDSSFAGNGTIRLGGGGAYTGFYSIISSDSFSNGKLFFNSAASSGTSHGHQFQVDGTAAVTIDASRRLLVGTSTARSWASVTGQFQLEGTSFDTSTPFFICNQNTGNSVYLLLGKTRGTSVGSNTIVQNGDSLGSINFAGADGSVLRTGANIDAFVDGTPGAGDMPGRLVFSVTTDGSASPTEAMRLENTGTMRVSGTIYRNGSCGIRFSGAAVIPQGSTGDNIDNGVDLGLSGARWRTIYAGTGTINTSDFKLKQDVEELDQAELSVAATIKGLIKKFRFTDAVAAKGNDARIHVGVIAQEVEQAFAAEGLNPRRYGMFCEDTLEDGSKRLGIRYDELLAFVIAAT
jgi:hypothetical protein